MNKNIGSKKKKDLELTGGQFRSMISALAFSSKVTQFESMCWRRHLFLSCNLLWNQLTPSIMELFSSLKCKIYVVQLLWYVAVS